MIELKKVRVLIAEDDYLVGREISNSLDKIGYENIGTATNGNMAVEMALSQKPDVVLMDIKMPELNGFEATKAIQERCKIPVVILTAYESEEFIEKSKKMGIYAYILKPPLPNEIKRNICIALARHNDYMKCNRVKEVLQLEITKRKKTEEELNKKNIELNSFINNIPDMAWVKDRDSNFIYVNKAFGKAIGMNTEQLVGNSCEMYFGKKAAKKFKEDDRKVMEVKKQITIEESIINTQGETVILETIKSPIMSESGDVIGTVGIARDINKRKQVEEELKQHTIELQDRNKELDAFAHTVAHDLKNPLGIVMGFADLLSEDYSNLSKDEISSYITAISQDSNKMNHIIDELLLLSSLRKTEVKMSPLNMSKIVAEATVRLSQMIDDYNAEIILPEYWEIALGYAPWIIEVWVNYISNAIKYGGRPPRIEIGYEKGKTLNVPEGMIRFLIRDNGQGISPDDQKLLFRKYERLDQIKTKGYGLGLSIVIRIIEKLGGQVDVESETGKGSTFYFTLPGESNKTKDKR